MTYKIKNRQVKKERRWGILITKNAGAGRLMGGNLYYTKRFAEEKRRIHYSIWRACLKVIPVEITYKLPAQAKK